MPRFTAYSPPPPPLFSLHPCARFFRRPRDEGGTVSYSFSVCRFPHLLLFDANFHRSYRHRFFSTADEKSAPTFIPTFDPWSTYRNFCSVLHALRFPDRCPRVARVEGWEGGFSSEGKGWIFADYSRRGLD